MIDHDFEPDDVQGIDFPLATSPDRHRVAFEVELAPRTVESMTRDLERERRIARLWEEVTGG